MILLGALTVGTVGYLLLRRPAPTVVLVQPAPPTPQRTETAADSVCCHVSGAVVEPGVYTLATGARVQDVIRAAGGAIADADLDSLNLAAVLRDQDRIIVPHQGAAPAPDSAEINRSQMLLLVDINTADSAELQTLPGIGPVYADRIIKYRSEFGPFESVEQLVQVNGIGEKTLADLLPFIVTGP